MIERVLNDFDIDQIANSGQCFRFHRVGDKSYSLIAGTPAEYSAEWPDCTVRLR